MSDAYTRDLARLCAEVVLLEPAAGELVALRTRLAHLAELAQQRGDAHAHAALGALEGVLREAPTDEVGLGAAFAALASTLSELEDAALLGPRPAGLPVALPVSREERPTATAEAVSAADPEVLAHYLTHHAEELARMEELVVALEAEDDPERARELGGMIHTLKGDSALVGLGDVAERCHALEDLLARRSAHAAADELLGAIDGFRQRLASLRSNGSAGPAPRAAVEEALAPRGAATRVASTVRVDSARLDLLVDRIGELVIAESMIGQCPEIRALASPLVAARLAQLEKITRELQGMAMSMRMVPVRATFQRMARLARDVARHLGKRVDFVLSGAETELDKTVVDAIADPLVHLVRNAVDHGVDAPEARARLGKPEVARIELRAFHRGGSLWLELEDDGAGLDERAILARARERNLIAAADEPEAAELHALIFQPGFTTAASVTEVSGRGIGLDVVQRTIQALRGRIEVRSRAGLGTTFSIVLPLTLAIIDGMLVRAGGQRYVLPTLAILHMLRLEPERVRRVFGRGRVLAWDRDLLPLHGLAELLDGAAPAPDERYVQVVVVEHEQRRLALGVDEILGQQQIVVKPLTSAHVARPGLAGGAILPDGSVGLILDLAALVAGTETVGDDVARLRPDERDRAPSLASIPQPALE